LVDRSGNVGQQLRPNHFGPFLIALTESWKEDCKWYGSFSESDLKRIEETASCAISIHSSFLTIRDEYRFVVQPIVAGEGSRLLEGVSLPERQQLKLAESKIFESGCVALRYLKQ
jgi:hypothetical protein